MLNPFAKTQEFHPNIHIFHIELAVLVKRKYPEHMGIGNRAVHICEKHKILEKRGRLP